MQLAIAHRPDRSGSSLSDARRLSIWRGTATKAAVRALIKRHNQRLFRVARGVVRDDAEAEDIVQETYVRAFTNLGSFRGEALLSTWLTRIALNEALGRVRRRRPAPSSTSSMTRRRPARRERDHVPHLAVVRQPGSGGGPEPGPSISWRRPSTSCRTRSGSSSSCATSRR